MVVNRSAPRATVLPILVYEDVGEAIDWLCSVFGFTECRPRVVRAPAVLLAVLLPHAAGDVRVH
jgi:hypothetical protein